MLRQKDPRRLRRRESRGAAEGLGGSRWRLPDPHGHDHLGGGRARPRRHRPGAHAGNPGLQVHVSTWWRSISTSPAWKRRGRRACSHALASGSHGPGGRVVGAVFRLLSVAVARLRGITTLGPKETLRHGVRGVSRRSGLWPIKGRLTHVLGSGSRGPGRRAVWSRCSTNVRGGRTTTPFMSKACCLTSTIFAGIRRLFLPVHLLILPPSCPRCWAIPVR